MAIRNDFAPGEVLAAADLNDTFGSKLDATDYRPGFEFLDKVNFTSSSAISLNGVFSGSYGLYKIVFTSNGNASLRLRASAADDSSFNYGLQFDNVDGSGSSQARSTGVNSWSLGGANGFFLLDLLEPFSAAPTVGYASVSSGGSTPKFANFALHHDVSSSFDGFTILGSSISGVVLVYGYN
jgi:hypothetical protein